MLNKVDLISLLKKLVKKCITYSLMNRKINEDKGMMGKVENLLNISLYE